MKLRPLAVFGHFCLALLGLLFVFFFSIPNVSLAVSSTAIIPYQGRLEDSTGNLYGGSFDFKFSIWTTSTVGQGTRLWPASAPASTTFQVSNGVFDARLGDTIQGFAAIDFTTTTSTSLYLQVEVYNSSSVSFETLSPRQIIVSTAFAINSTNANALIQFDSSGGIIIPNGTSTFSSNLVVSGATTLSGVSFTNATGTGNLQVATLAVTGATSLQNLSFANATGTGNFSVDGFVSSTQLRSPSATITGSNFTNATGTNFTV
ncbi:MAG: hypothetical protein G01um101420_762, partial [Parcubacteria group bacterium Gr01-1014_20]